jgi:hypothetical protein
VLIALGLSLILTPNLLCLRWILLALENFFWFYIFYEKCFNFQQNLYQFKFTFFKYKINFSTFTSLNLSTFFTIAKKKNLIILNIL